MFSITSFSALGDFMNGTQNSRCLGVVTSTVNMTSTEGLFAEEIVHCSLSDENATAYKCTVDTCGYRHIFPSRRKYKNISENIRETPARRDDYNWRTQRYRGKCIPLRVINNSAFSQQTQLCFLSPWLISAVCVSSQYDINSSKILINLRLRHSY